MFGTESAKPTGGNSLGGIIASKAFQTIKEARSSDKKENKKKKQKGKSKSKSQKNSPQSNRGGLLSGSLGSLTSLFKPDKGKPEEVKSKQPRTSGGSTGLAKILTQGFGSLTADTLGLASGLASVTNILNQQLKAQSFTATGVQTITSILSDQLENQSSIVSGVKSLRPGGGTGKGGKGMFGSSKAKTTSNDTLTGFIAAEIQKKLEQLTGVGAGVLIRSALSRAGLAFATNPLALSITGGLVAGYVAGEGVKNKDKFSEESITNDPEKDKKIRENLAPSLGGTSQVRSPAYLPAGDPRRWKFDNPGKPIPQNIQQQLAGMPSAGPWDKRSEGGVKLASGAMIGEAGKEAVVDLNSRSARNMLNPSASEGDPGIKTSGAALLTGVSQFVQGLDPQLRGPVSQAVSPDIAEYSKKFGVSQLLPNIKIGGGKFKEDGNAKKTRDKFLQDLIAGSLTALDAKKKDENKKTTPTPNPTTTTPPPGTTPPQSNPSSNKPQGAPGSPNGSGRPMDGNYTDPGSHPGAAIPALTVEEGRHLENKEVKQRYLPFRPESKWNKSHHILLNSGNGSFEIWEKPGIFNWAPKMVYQGKKDNAGRIQNSAIATEAFNEVRSFMRVHMPESAKNTFKWITETDISNAKNSRVRGDQEKGGTIKPAPRFDAGGGVQKPWWDFLGLVTGMKSIDQGKTGVYSDTLTGRMGNRTATTNKAIEEMLGRSKGFATGGSLFTPESEKAMTSLELTKEVQHLKNVTKIFGSTVIQITDVLSDDGSYSATPPTPIKSAPKVTATPPVAATAEENVDTGSAAIINVIAGGGGSQSIPMTSNNSSQTTVDYINDPWPAGLAGIVCTSPWSVV